MATTDWWIWFWLLVALMVLGSCVCAAATFYGCCYNGEDACPSCMSCCCCSYTGREYTTLQAEDEQRDHFERSRPRTPEFLGEYTAENSSNTEGVQGSSTPVLSNAAQIARARRLLPMCKIFKFSTKSTFLIFRRPKKCKNDVCPICIEQYLQGDSLVLCPCKHAYHLNCLEGWLKVKGICPLCKRPIKNEISERSPLLYPFV